MQPKVPERVAIIWIYQLLLSVRRLQNKGVVHGELMPKNICVDEVSETTGVTLNFIRGSRNAIPTKN